MQKLTILTALFAPLVLGFLGGLNMTLGVSDVTSLVQVGDDIINSDPSRSKEFLNKACSNLTLDEVSERLSFLIGYIGNKSEDRLKVISPIFKQLIEESRKSNSVNPEKSAVFPSTNSPLGGVLDMLGET